MDMAGKKSSSSRRSSGTKGPYKSAISGRFVTKGHATRSPKTTYGKCK